MTGRDAQPRRILHLLSSDRWTGPADPVASLAREQQALGHQVWLGCIPDSGVERRAHRLGLTTVPELRLSRKYHPFAVLSDLARLPQFCREKHVDILHCHLLHDHWLAALAGLFCRADMPALVRTRHRPSRPRRDALHRWLFRKRTRGILTTAPSLARETRSVLDLPEERVLWTPGGVDLETFHPDVNGRPLRHRMKISDAAAVAGMVGRMRKGRGWRWLVRAAPAVLQAVPVAHIVAVGRGEIKDWYKAQIENPAFDGRAHYAGYRTILDEVKRWRPDLPACYRGMDVALFLGLTNEGSCRSMLEAMASGRAVIALRSGPTEDILREGETGFFVEPNNAEDLAEKMILMLRDRSLCHTMGLAARKDAEQRFTQRGRAEAVLQAYTRFLKAGPA